MPSASREAVIENPAAPARENPRNTTFVFGPSGLWKTFLTISFGMSIATGTNWMGREVKTGSVLYIAGEGARNIGKRIQAWKLSYGYEGQSRMRVLNMMVRFLDDQHLARLARQIREVYADMPPALTVVDTLALAMEGGDENAAKDTGRLLGAAHRLQRITGCKTVLFIHHTGYDESHMRGSTNLHGNSDFVIKIEAPVEPDKLKPGMPLALVCRKMRDEDYFGPVTITTDLEVWNEDTGKMISSLVAVPYTGNGLSVKQTPTSPSPKEFTDAAVKAWKYLAKLCVDHADGATHGEWFKEAVKAPMAASTFNAAISSLTTKDWVRRSDAGKYRVATPGTPDPTPPGWADTFFGPRPDIAGHDGGDLQLGRS